MRQQRLIWVNANTVVQLAAQTRRKIQYKSMLIGFFGAGAFKFIVLELAYGIPVGLAADQQLHDHVLGLKTVQSYCNVKMYRIAETDTLARHIQPPDRDARPYLS